MFFFQKQDGKSNTTKFFHLREKWERPPRWVQNMEVFVIEIPYTSGRRDNVWSATLGEFFFWMRFENLVAQTMKSNDRVAPNLVVSTYWRDLIYLLRSKKVTGCVLVPTVIFFALKLAKLGQMSWFTHIKWEDGLRDISKYGFSI